ncbi:MAG: hypothetical protein AABW53_01315 [Nanoarchaeota archaeon]
MHNFLVEEGLRKILQKAAKKDKVMYEAVMKKFDEIIFSADVEHYREF